MKGLKSFRKNFGSGSSFGDGNRYNIIGMYGAG